MPEQEICTSGLPSWNPTLERELRRCELFSDKYSSHFCQIFWAELFCECSNDSAFPHRGLCNLLIMFFLHIWEYFLFLWTLDQKCAFPFILMVPGLLRMLKRNSEYTIIAAWLSYSRCLGLIKLLLGKAVLLLNFAHLLLQKEGHVASVGKKSFEPTYMTYFEKKKKQKTCSYRKLAGL